ncbi:MAG TPA: M14 family metallopeptidase [Candidatus Saccharimonadales bacterium]|nr:M14 family metallopeptidase [Candidatus Saccharimonadales bacterium]
MSVKAEGRVRLGGISLISTSICFTAAQAPKEGQEKLAVSPFGGVFAKKTFNLSVPSPPKASVEVLSKPLPVTKSLSLPLSSIDGVFSYALKVGDKTTGCPVEDKGIVCDVAKLGLAQGVSYDMTLSRSFKGKDMDTLAKHSIQTLPATRLINSSIQPGEVVFAKPKTIDLVFDKRLVRYDVKLYKKIADKKEEITTQSKLSDKGVTLILSQDLPRESIYELELNSIEAIDGSGLEDSVIVPFTTSGGPKVVSISAKKTGTPVGSTVTITFDQPISGPQDTSKAMKLSGGAAYAGKNANQVFVSLKDTPKCGDYSIEFTNSLLSSYDITGGSSWSFLGRTLCHTIGTIGYSVAGRAINAYYFGNGPKTIVYTGAIHGNEVGTKYLMDRWVQDLEANARSIPADKSVIVIPQLNPDGVAAGTRTNRRNVDLNRNFAVSDWQKDITDVNNKPFPGGGGEAPMSEPEVKAIASLVSRTRPIFVMSFHSIGGVLAANQAGDSSSRATTYSQMSGYRNTTGRTAETFDYSITGTADDWYAEKLGISSVLVELSSHTSAQFDRNQKALWRMLTM